jgi:hypothetical protein
LHLDYEHPAGHFEPFKRWAAGAAQDDHGREAREQVAGLRVADREGSAEPARRLGSAVLRRAGPHDRVRALACVAEVVRVATREQDDIAAAYVLDVRVPVDPKHEFALFDDVQAADIGETDRESPRRSVRNDPFSAQADAPEQFREQVVRLTIRVETERGFLKRWRISKLLRRSEQIGWRGWHGWRGWTIGKISRRIDHGPCPFL